MERAGLTKQAPKTLRMTTPIGELELVAQAGELVAIRMEGQGEDEHPAAASHGRRRAADHAANDADTEILTTAKRQLEGLLRGEVRLLHSSYATQRDGVPARGLVRTT